MRMRRPDKTHLMKRSTRLVRCLLALAHGDTVQNGTRPEEKFPLWTGDPPGFVANGMRPSLTPVW